MTIDAFVRQVSYCVTLPREENWFVLQVSTQLGYIVSRCQRGKLVCSAGVILCHAAQAGKLVFLAGVILCHAAKGGKLAQEPRNNALVTQLH